MSKNVQIVDQTSLFSALPDEERKQFEPVTEEKPATPTRAVTKAPAKPAEEPEPEVYEIDRTVFYAGHRLDVPSREMKLEQVRAWLENEHFPELTTERTEMIYDKETGHIVPVLKAHKKGALQVLTEHPEIPVPVYYLLAEDGRVYEVRSTQTGIFSVPVVGTAAPEQPFQLFVPKFPVSVLEEIVEVFKSEPGQEHLAYVVWDSYRGYSVQWPEQSATSVSVEGTGFVETEERFVVSHIHSHGTLPAFFSGQDNADEVRTGLYGVIGYCDKEKPVLLFRYSCAGKYVTVDPRNVISGDIEHYVTGPWTIDAPYPQGRAM
jgi:PRTRC genetic system protein A